MQHIFYKDPTTFRVVRFLCSANVNLSTLPSTINVFVPGLATAVSYNIGLTQNEKIRTAGPSFNKIDHP
jgi:hypothetical protein